MTLRTLFGFVEERIASRAVVEQPYAFDLWRERTEGR